MPNGSPGDGPLGDIINHHLLVYSPAADALVRKIFRLADERTRRDFDEMLSTRYYPYKPSDKPDVAELERELTRIWHRLREDAAARGWELEE